MTDKCRRCIDYDKNSETCRLDIKDEPCGWFVEKPFPWHTGTPTEEGDYLLQIEHMCKTYFVAWTLKRFGEELIPKIPQSTVAWWKIEPYKEKEDGHTD